MSTIPLNSKLLKELLNSTNLTARLFTNNLLDCEDLPSSIQFEEASFNGYSPKFLNPLLWYPTNQAIESYTKYKYSNGIIWKNLGSAGVVTGYYITDQDNQVLWFEKFDNEITLNQNEGTLVNMEVEINNYDFPKTTITLVVKNNNAIPQNISVTTQNIKWGGIDYNDSFLDLLNNDFAPRNNMIFIGVKSTVKPCQEESLQFDLTVSAQGFETYQENISITNSGNNIRYIYLDQLAVSTTISPIDIPNPFQGLFSFEILNNDSSTSDKIFIKVYKPIAEQLKNINISDISFNLIGSTGLLTDESLPDQLQSLANFTEMNGAFSFVAGGTSSFTINNIVTIPSQNGNTIFFSGTMNENSILGRWVAGDVFSAELTFNNLNLFRIINNQTNNSNSPSGTIHYLLLNNFNFNVSGINYHCNSVSDPCYDGGKRIPNTNECCPPPGPGDITGSGLPSYSIRVKGFGYSDCLGECAYCSTAYEFGDSVWSESNCRCECITSPEFESMGGCEEFVGRNYRQKEDNCLCYCPKDEIKYSCESRGFEYNPIICGCNCESNPNPSEPTQASCPVINGTPLWDEVNCMCPCDEALDSFGVQLFPSCNEKQQRGPDCRCECKPDISISCPDIQTNNNGVYPGGTRRGLFNSETCECEYPCAPTIEGGISAVPTTCFYQGETYIVCNQCEDPFVLGPCNDPIGGSRICICPQGTSPCGDPAIDEFATCCPEGQYCDNGVCTNI